MSIQQFFTQHLVQFAFAYYSSNRQTGTAFCMFCIFISATLFRYITGRSFIPHNDYLLVTGLAKFENIKNMQKGSQFARLTCKHDPFQDLLCRCREEGLLGAVLVPVILKPDTSDF